MAQHKPKTPNTQGAHHDWSCFAEILAINLCKPGQPSHEHRLDEQYFMDALINFVYEDAKYGKDDIIEAAGETVRKEFDENCTKDDALVKQGVVITNAGTLPVKKIFHITVFSEPEQFQAALRSALHSAYDQGLRSLSVPALPSSFSTITKFERKQQRKDNTVDNKGETTQEVGLDENGDVLWWEEEDPDEGKLLIAKDNELQGHNIQYFRSGLHIQLIYSMTGGTSSLKRGQWVHPTKCRGGMIINIILPVYIV